MSLGRFTQARQTDPVARNKRCRYAGPGTTRHFRAQAALPAPHHGSRNLSEKHLLRRPMARGGDDGSGAPEPALGQRKELLFLSSRREFCCINQLSEEPNTIKPKQSPKLGGKTSLMYIHWVMLHLWEGTPVRPKGKKSRWRINQRQFLPQVGREANST